MNIRLLLVIFAVLVAIVLARLPLKILWADIVLDNREINRSCSQLPHISEVIKIVEEHDDLVNKIKEISSSNEVTVQAVAEDRCDDKGYVGITYGTHKQRKQIENLVGTTFIGMPWRGTNI